MSHFDRFSAGTTIRARGLSDIYPATGKRLLDLGVSLFLLPFLLPVIAITWALTRAQGGPGFYAHTRIGQNGRLFRCYKIRTMRPDSDRLLRDYLHNNATAAAEWMRCQKLKDDPRITPLGRFLRRTSLDELPQILNVLRGEMSLVGPRPITRGELSFYAPAPAVYLAQKPGVTGLWQVYGRGDGCYRRRVQFDRSYLQRVSLGTDLELIARTALTLLRPSGC